ncbi:MAG: HEAT repeat domain-containing protein [Planctomycetaceae bacterium]|nr:HEAT repeat domain-containing protein [Planctomycetaceae bacterium]
MRSSISTSLLELLFGACAVLESAPALADVVRLKNGGEVRGTVETAVAGQAATDLTVTTLTGARVTLRRDDVQFVTRRSLKIEEYETRAREMTPTVDAHWELAEWCRENRLPRQREEQLQRILELETDHEAARRGLGYTRHGEQWMTRHEVMQADGYVRHNGRYVTRQELELIEKTQVQRDAEQEWLSKVRLWFAWATGSHAGRRTEGMQQLHEIRDPNAIHALAKLMADHDDPQVRRLFVDILGRMQGAAPVAPLVRRSLVDSDATIRTAAMSAIDPAQHKGARTLYVESLRNELRLIVCRAAVALGVIGDRYSVPPLIDALVTEHRYRVTYQEQTPSFAVGADGSIGFPGSTSGLPADVEFLARTGQLPYGAVVLPPPGRTVTKSTIIKRREENMEVLGALKNLTGQDYGFDQRSWGLWWAASQNGANVGKSP